MSAPLCCRLATAAAAKRPSHACRIPPAVCMGGSAHVCVCTRMTELYRNDPDARQDYWGSVTQSLSRNFLCTFLQPTPPPPLPQHRKITFLFFPHRFYFAQLYECAPLSASRLYDDASASGCRTYVSVYAQEGESERIDHDYICKA